MRQTNRKIVVAAALAAVLAGCGGAGQRAQVAGLEKFESAEGGFSVSVPADWARNGRFPYAIDDTVNGVMLEGPRNADGAAVKIAVLHYAGTGSIEGADHYIGKVLFNPTRLDAETDPEMSEVEVAGIKGKTFTFAKFELITLPFDPPPMKEGVVYEIRPPTKQVTMAVRYIVLPAERGFHSLRYEAPEEMAGEYAPVFDAVVESFRFLKK
jgi:hypothetical protein